MISETYVFGIIAGVGFSIAILLLVPIFIDAMSVLHVQPISQANWIDKSIIPLFNTYLYRDHKKTLKPNQSSLRKIRTCSYTIYCLSRLFVLHQKRKVIEGNIYIYYILEGKCWKVDENETWNWMTSSRHPRVTSTNDSWTEVIKSCQTITRALMLMMIIEAITITAQQVF